MSKKAVGPSSSAEVFAPPDAPASLGALSLVPVAAFGFALLAWAATAYLGYHSESKGIAGATVAMFPSGFGVAGLIVRAQEKERVLQGQRPRLGLLFGVSFAGGILCMMLFIGFMAGIWPAL